MHQWNFEAVDGTLVVWRPGTRTDVGAALRGQARWSSAAGSDGAWEHVIIRKAT